MAKINLLGNKTVAKLKQEFNSSFGSVLKVYNGGQIAEDTATLSNLGLKNDSILECRSSLTAGSFIKRMNEIGLKVTIWTKDEHVKVLDGLTLEASLTVISINKKRATCTEMCKRLACIDYCHPLLETESALSC